MKTLTHYIKNISAPRRVLVWLRGELRRLRPGTLDAGRTDYLERFRAESEVARRWPRNELQRIGNEWRGETVALRSRAAGVLVFRLRSEVYDFSADALRAVETTRRDTRLSFPSALDHLTADGMATAELLRFKIYERLARATPAQLLATYQRALDRQDLRGYIEAAAIEEMADGGSLVPTSDDDLPILKRLRDHAAGVQELRLPDLPDFAELAAEASRLEARASLLQIVPVDPETDREAAAAFEAEREAIEAAGAASDADDHAALRRELAGGAA